MKGNKNFGDGQVLEHLKDKLRTGGVRVFKGPFINNVILRGCKGVCIGVTTGHKSYTLPHRAIPGGYCRYS